MASLVYQKLSRGEGGLRTNRGRARIFDAILRRRVLDSGLRVETRVEEGAPNAQTSRESRPPFKLQAAGLISSSLRMMRVLKLAKVDVRAMRDP